MNQSSSLPTLSILNSLTGKKVFVNSYKFNSLESLKEYISSCFDIPASLLFILTPFGIKLKFSMILHDQINEIYVFDRNCFNLNDHNREEIRERLKLSEPLNLLKPVDSPLSSFNGFKENNLRASINALKRNSGWAAAILSDFKKTRHSAFKEEEDMSIEIILRSLNVLIQYLSLSSQTLQKNLDGSVSYLSNLKEHSLVSSWEDHFKILKKITFKLSGREINLANSISKGDLAQIAKDESVKLLEADQILSSIIAKIQNEIKNERHKLENDFHFLKEKYHTPLSQESSADNIGNSQILKLESLVQEIIEDVNDLPAPDTKDVNYVKNCFNRHLEELNPQISQIATDLYKRQVNLLKNKILLQENLFDYIFTNVAKIQISLINVQKVVTNELQPRLTALQTLEVKLSIVSDLPLIFGILIIAKYKNYQWFQNFRKICFKTSEIFEMIQFMETNTRTKWFQKIMGGNFNSPSEITSSNGFLGHYLDFLGNLRQDDFVNEHMAILQLLFESKLNNKVAIDTTTSNINNKALNKFINSLNNNLPTNTSDNGTIWTELQVTNINDIYNYIQKLKEVLPDDRITKNLEKNVTPIQDLSFQFLKLFAESTGIKNDEPQIKSHDNVDIIKGYENRVKKLENLLHQQQFLQFNQQFQHSPSVRNLNPMKVDTLNDAANSISLEPNRTKINLPYNRRFSTSSNASDNGESGDYKKQLTKVNEENQDLQKQLQLLREQLNEKISENDNLKNELTASNSNSEIVKSLKEEKLELELELKTVRNSMEKGLSSEDEVTTLKKELENLKQELVDEKTKWEHDYIEVNSMKNDLIENMSSLQKDHKEESSAHLKEIEDLKFKVEELESLRDELQCSNTKLTDAIHDKNQVVENLSNIIDSMYLKLKELTQKVFIDLSIFCVVLESIGLLLIQEDDQIKIIRVKGLKKNKNLKTQVSSDVILQVEKHLYWTDLSIENETTSVKEMVRESSPVAGDDSGIIGNSITELDIHSKALIHKFHNDNFEKNYQIFYKTIDIEDELLINSVTKRFKDVENLARKFQKDLNLQKIEIDNLLTLAKSKISIRNFTINDLVLFLPTTEEFNKDNSTAKQWAAFNIGAPHYFLQNSDKDEKNYIDLSNREWLVARILSIQEFTITEESFNNENLNPFKLNIGVSWYFVDAKEELLE